MPWCPAIQCCAREVGSRLFTKTTKPRVLENMVLLREPELLLACKPEQIE